MALQNKRLVPELNFWIDNVIVNKSPIKEKFFKLPIPVTEGWRNKNTILELLFNETYEYDPVIEQSSSSSSFTSLPDDIYYMYKQSDVSTITDPNVANRITIYAGSIQVLTPYTGGAGAFENVFDITEEDLELLFHLFDYKVNSLINLGGITYTELESPLAKLIYIFLKIESNEDVSIYLDDFPLSADGNSLHCLYEKYVADYLYRLNALAYATTYHITDVVGARLLDDMEDHFFVLTSNALLLEVTSAEETNKVIQLNEGEIPLDSENDLILIQDGSIVPRTNYSFVLDETDPVAPIPTITWTGNKFLEGNKLFLAWAYVEPHTYVE